MSAQHPQGIGVGLTGLGVYLPETVRRNEDWPQHFRDTHAARIKTDLTTAVDHAVAQQSPDVDPEVARTTVKWAHDLFRGTKQRRVMAPDERSSDMEVAACRDALARAGRTPDEIDLYYGYSMVPDLATPANHGRVHQRLGLPLHAAAATLDVGCASFLPQLVTAARMIQVGEHQRALIAASSAISRITDYDAPSSVNGGDGAVAAVVERIEPGYGYIGQCQQTRGDLHAGVVLASRSHPEVPWYRGDLHRERLLSFSRDRDAQHEMGAHAARMCREVCVRLLDRYELTADDVDFFVVAQATAWFGEALAAAVGIDDSRRIPVDEHYARFAHLLPASMALNLAVAHRSGRLRRGDLILMYTPGAGYTQAAALYRWNLDT